MKLGELRSAIRGHKGTIRVQATLAGEVVLIPVQKTAFVSDTLEAFGDHKNVESNLILTDDGILMAEGDGVLTGAEGSDDASQATCDDADDLMGDLDETDAGDDDGFDDLLG
jgi:hypothetical protein